MIGVASAPPQTLEPTRGLSIRVATADDRPWVYRLRHQVYAEELAQHPVNAARMLSDPLDAYNEYLIAEVAGQPAGFISITPPPSRPDAASSHRYSIDKYISRDRLPFRFDEGLYELRLLTVAAPYRHSRVGGLLMYAALRWIEARGAHRVVAIGRRELMTLYRKVGFRGLGIEAVSGAVAYEVMHASIARLRRSMGRFAGRLRRAAPKIDWRLDAPFEPPADCHHGGAFFEAVGDDFNDLDRRHRVINADVLDAWFDPSPAVLRTLGAHLGWLARTSPPTGCEGLVRAIAAARGVDPRCILPGGGSSDLIYLALRQWLGPSSRVLILEPMYGEYAHLLHRAIGCRVERFTLRRDDDYEVDLARLAGRLQRGYDLAILVNPNNPTGRHIPMEDLARLITAAPERTRFWIDEAYIDYIGPGRSLERFAAHGPNTLVCKSMSKVYGLSGLRVGYLCGPRALIDELRPLTPPWAVSLPAQVAAVEALRDPDYYVECYQRTRMLREGLARRLRADCGLRTVPSAANFLLCHLPEDGPEAPSVVEACRQHGLFIRDMTDMSRCLGHHAVRIAVKDAATNSRMSAILGRVLSDRV